MKTTGSVPAQQSTAMPRGKYRPFLDVNPISLPDRQWPNNRIVKAPRWLSTDLRDGNQALVEPMDPARKRKLFDQLVNMGFQEIEIGFPAASQTDFDFVRSLVDDDAVPENVTISVLTQSRPEIIERTVESLVGFPRATVHLYNATAPVFRDIVFGNNWEQTVDLAVSGTREVMAQAEKRLGDETIFGFEYSPEVFIDTEIDRALEICDAVMGIWQPGDDREIILNLPGTIERATPNVYADQIEYMSRHLPHRDHVVVSVHPHNDRGTGVAAAELALLAGADRVEGCLFGQGERTGNVDLVTVALNLYTQGVDPQLDFSDIDQVRGVVEYCTQMKVPERTPYAGDLVYTSFSGSHQDAIKKGFAVRDAQLAKGISDNELAWNIPYLPIDPHDVGRTYEAVVRVNSQSGKGGIAYLMSNAHSLELPRRLQVEFSRLVQRYTDAHGGEIDADTLWKVFADAYLPASAAHGLEPWGRFQLGSTSVRADGDVAVLEAELFDRGQRVKLQAKGNGPVDAFVHALTELGFDMAVRDYSEHALSRGKDAEAASYIEAEIDGQIVWGVGIDASIARATYKAVISALNRALR
ncbi:2-isopropylmalate synthase [Actinomycetaceae bacterium WB03_NA08]|uniref:2-isopropylmalate synthase n=1 Tax=Scrofimicrobium canadense TaxID=2652290 RepID=A0A6N7W359_9ACTO|nr:2-isopropylmalate synthase [Scrofimicrobium canadense]MSS83861.1 2-isopropylmalate synthase [Scrofimicrobium canadense]